MIIYLAFVDVELGFFHSEVLARENETVLLEVGVLAGCLKEMVNLSCTTFDIGSAQGRGGMKGG